MVIKKRKFDAKYADLTAPLPFKSKDEIGGPTNTWDKPRVTCTCYSCATQRKMDAFLFAPQQSFGYTDEAGRRRVYFCYYCLPYLFEKFKAEEPDKNPYKALYRICSLTGIYYDHSIAKGLYEEQNRWDDGTPVYKYEPYVILYIRYINDDPELSKKYFYDSDNYNFDDAIARQQMSSRDEYLLSDHDRQNRRFIMSVYHYDPFASEPLVDKPSLYEDLVSLMDDSFGEDVVKAKAGVELVYSFLRLKKVNELLTRLQSTDDSMVENAAVIKELVQQKQKETSMISTFAKDNGFSEKYASSKGKGSGTLSAIVRDMTEQGYDRGIVNKFDVDTAAAMQQVSDISAESMFKQLTLTETDYADMVREQGIQIRKMQRTMEAQAEELRLLKEKRLKEEILKEYERELEIKGIDPKEIAGFVQQELDYRPKVVGNTYFTEDDLAPAAVAEDEEGSENAEKNS